MMKSPFTPARGGRARVIGSTGRSLPLAVLLAAGLAGWSGVAAPPAMGQLIAPVFVDDSAGAADALARAGDFVASGNVDEAVRVLQSLLESESERVVATDGDAELFLSVRRHAHDLLLAHPRLMERYRQIQGPAAERLLGMGADQTVEGAFLFTSAGFEAALRVDEPRAVIVSAGGVQTANRDFTSALPFIMGLLLFLVFGAGRIVAMEIVER